jgi:hypothetical protein
MENSGKQNPKALVLCSCAEGFHLKHAADGDRDNLGHGYVSGSGDPGGA